MLCRFKVLRCHGEVLRVIHLEHAIFLYRVSAIRLKVLLVDNLISWCIGLIFIFVTSKRQVIDKTWLVFVVKCLVNSVYLLVDPIIILVV